LKPLRGAFQFAGSASGLTDRAHLAAGQERRSAFGPHPLLVRNVPSIVAETIIAEDHSSKALGLLDDLVARDQCRSVAPHDRLTRAAEVNGGWATRGDAGAVDVDQRSLTASRDRPTLEVGHLDGSGLKPSGADPLPAGMAACPVTVEHVLYGA